MARRLAKPRYRALPRALFHPLQHRRPGPRRLVRAQARRERRQEVGQGRAVARLDVPLSARGRFRGGELRPGLPLEQPLESDAQAAVLDQGSGRLENPIRRSGMTLKSLLKPLVVLSAAAAAPGALSADPQVDVRTNVGTIRLELYPGKAPKTVENFLQYVRDGHYNGTVFHRVIDGFMIQGGGFDGAFKQKPTRSPVVNEAQPAVKAGLTNTVGTIAMARTADPNSATAQFFINVGDLVECWAGDDALADPFNSLIAGFLQALSRGGVKLALMHGNRDFLFGERFCAATGAQLLEDPVVAPIGGVPTLLMHGDTLCTGDTDYQNWRRVARSAEWQRDILSKPLAERRAIGRGLREKSR